MKKFETPAVEVTTFTVEDIITESTTQEDNKSVTVNCTGVQNPDW